MESADLRKDCPDVDRLLANFLSRAVIDEVLPPAFLMDRSLAEASPEVLEQAKALLRCVCARAGASGCAWERLPAEPWVGNCRAMVTCVVRGVASCWSRQHEAVGRTT